jgi:hypothetical protein
MKHKESKGSCAVALSPSSMKMMHRKRANGAASKKAHRADMRLFVDLETPTSLGGRQHQHPGSSFLWSCLSLPIGC